MVRAAAATSDARRVGFSVRLLGAGPADEADGGRIGVAGNRRAPVFSGRRRALRPALAGRRSLFAGENDWQRDRQADSRYVTGLRLRRVGGGKRDAGPAGAGRCASQADLGCHPDGPAGEE